MKNKAVIIVIAIIFIGAGIWFLRAPITPPKYTGPVEKLRFCTSNTDPVSAPVFVAQKNNYFAEYGLDIEFTYRTAGIFCLQDLIDGKTDLATAAATGFMFKNFENPNLKILASLATSENNIRMVAQKSLISKPADLKGKTIGVTARTDAHFFLNSLLAFAGLQPRDVTILNFKPEELPAALKEKKVDAIMTWEPNITNAQTLLGDQAITLLGQSGQNWYWLLASRQDAIQEKAEIIKRFLSALIEADAYIEAHPAESQKIVSKNLSAPLPYVEEALSHYTFSILLRQDLIVSLENAARWAIENKFTTTTATPNYLNGIYFDALKAVKPEAVTIIH